MPAMAPADSELDDDDPDPAGAVVDVAVDDVEDETRVAVDAIDASDAKAAGGMFCPGHVSYDSCLAIAICLTRSVALFALITPSIPHPSQDVS